MIICEFCLQYQLDGKCAYGLNIPKRMGCREFDPGIEKFCADPTDFKGAGQIIQMATFFGIKGMELKKIKLIAAREEQARTETSQAQIDSLVADVADRRDKDESTIKGFDSDELLNESK